MLIVSIFVNPTVGRIYPSRRSTPRLLPPIHLCLFLPLPTPAPRQQFGPNEDFDKYPRTLERDVELAKGVGKACVDFSAVRLGNALTPSACLDFSTRSQVRTTSSRRGWTTCTAPRTGPSHDSIELAGC